MKRTIIVSAICALLLGAGCTKQPKNDDGLEPGTAHLMITVEGANTRARFYSEETITPDIPSVDVYVFRQEVEGEIFPYLKTIHIDDFVSGEAYLLTGGDYLAPEFNYQFVAVGAAADSPYDITVPEVGVTGYGNIRATLDQGEQAGDFYGGFGTMSSALYYTTIPITMTRKVSGVLGYFGNVPDVWEGEKVGYLRLNTLNFRSFQAWVGVSGALPNDEPLTLLEFDFTEQTADAGVYPGLDVDGDGTDIVQLPNTYLQGAFAVSGLQKLSLDLMDVTGENVLHSWPIFDEDYEDGYYFQPNTLYRIGRKKMAGNTNGGTPEDSTDDDEPFNIMDEQVLVIYVNPEWEDFVDLL